MVDDSQHRLESSILGPILLWITACGLVDLIAPWVIEVVTPGVIGGRREPELLMLFFGAFCGQVGVLGIWAVLGPGRWLVRWPISLLVMTFFWGVLLLGIAMANLHGPSIYALFAATLTLSLLFLAVQLPLWVLRLVTGWCLVVGGGQDAASPARRRQFGVQHMLGATTVVAVAMGLAGLGLSVGGGRNTSADTSSWLALLLVCLFVSVWSTFSTLPCLWAALVVRNRVAGAVAIAIYAVLMSLLVVGLFSALGGYLPSTEGVRIFMPFTGSLAFVLLGT